MANLTVAEKNHWRDRIQARIDRRIEAITADDPGLLERVRREARGRAMESLGLAGMQEELDRMAQQRAELDHRDTQIRREMLAKVRGVPVDAIEGYTRFHDHPEIRAAIAKRQEVHEEELLAGDDLGREVVRLRVEQENLLDVIWLATSPVQVRQLWTKVAALLGEEPTRLDAQCAVDPAERRGGMMSRPYHGRRRRGRGRGGATAAAGCRAVPTRSRRSG